MQPLAPTSLISWCLHNEGFGRHRFESWGLYHFFMRYINFSLILNTRRLAFEMMFKEDGYTLDIRAVADANNNRVVQNGSISFKRYVWDRRTYYSPSLTELFYGDK